MIPVSANPTKDKQISRRRFALLCTEGWKELQVKKELIFSVEIGSSIKTELDGSVKEFIVPDL